MLDAQRTAFSPNGWIDDCPAAADGCDATRGNNVDACLDRDASSNVCDAGTLDSNGRAIGNPDSGGRNRDFLGAAPRDFVHTPAPSGANPDAGDNPLNPDSQRGALVLGADEHPELVALLDAAVAPDGNVADAVVVRPDRYVLGGAPTLQHLAAIAEPFLPPV